MKKTLIVIAGPTAIGKTSVAIDIAQHFKTEIISADSRQFYRETTVGTAKPSAAELNKIKHHFINSLSIEEAYNAGQFEMDALQCLTTIFSMHEVAVVVGGSGLFIDALCHGMDQLPESDPGIRDDLKKVFQEKGITALQQELALLDPEYYRVVDLANPHRLIRAIEVCRLTGLKYSGIRKKENKKRDFAMIKIGLDDERTTLYRNINNRVDQMMKDGLLDESKSLYPYKHLNALKTVGYQELFDFLDNKITLEEAIELIKRNTRRYAKRQLTWFRNDNEISWFKPGDVAKIIQWLEGIMELR